MADTLGYSGSHCALACLPENCKRTDVTCCRRDSPPLLIGPENVNRDLHQRTHNSGTDGSNDYSASAEQHCNAASVADYR
ncbi:unnamed protein product [Anisakis simplex]|uniref:CFEM domain-containing protein n=1 Tax=Anisakis simplex TaxID=6269 RepID=A0A0M3K5R5_ANISI|nr:unnamed protein product [Anisakis simplex]